MTVKIRMGAKRLYESGRGAWVLRSSQKRYSLCNCDCKGILLVHVSVFSCKRKKI